MAKTALSKKAILAKGILLGKIAADSHLDLNQVLAGVKRKNWLAKKPGIAAAIKPHLAKDANLDQVIDLLDRLDGMDDNDMSQDDDMDDMDAAMDDGCEAIMSKLRGKIADDDLSEIEGMLKARGMPKNAAEDEDDDKAKEKADEDKTASDEDEDDDKKAAEDEDEDEDKDKMKKDKEDKMDKAAMDRAIKLACDATAKDAERKTIARMRAIAEAEELVKPFVGKLTAMDSAEDVLKAALIALNVDVKDVHPSAYRTILKYIPNPNEPTHQASGLATDRSISPTSDMYDIFPNLLTK